MELRSARLVDLVPLAETVRDELRVQGHKAGARVQREVQRGDVAEAQQRLGIRPDGFVVDQVEIAQRHPATGEREDRMDLPIAQQPVERFGDLPRPRGGPPPTSPQVDQRRHVDGEPHLLDGLHAALEQRRRALLEPAGQGRHRDEITLPQRLRTQDRRHAASLLVASSDHRMEPRPPRGTELIGRQITVSIAMANPEGVVAAVGREDRRVASVVPADDDPPCEPGEG
jgi:hypothetical protein